MKQQRDALTKPNSGSRADASEEKRRYADYEIDTGDWERLAYV
jgi:hypothetical protein